MSGKRRLAISTAKMPALTIARSAVKAEKLVYFAVANKRLKYAHGQSAVVYIGTTKNGASRVASSAASKATELLEDHGIKQLSFYVVTCGKRQNVETWRKLENGLILAFKHMYGTPPKCNKQGKNQSWKDELDYFSRLKLEKVIKQYS